MRRPKLPHIQIGRRSVIALLIAGAAAFGTGLALPHRDDHRVHRAAPPVDKGLWISRAEIAKLPRRGPAWRRLLKAAKSDIGRGDVADQNSTHDVETLAVALVFARTRDERYREKAVDALMSAIGTENGARALAVGRNVAAYVIAADLVNLRGYDPPAYRRFADWLRRLRTETFRGRTLAATHEIRPNNWGTMAGASRIAIDVYLGDAKDLARAATVFRGWLGDRAAYHGFLFGRDDTWQLDPSNPVAVQPAGATLGGLSVDGALSADMRRGGKFRIPPKRTEYPWGALAGALVQAQLLSRQGYDAWQWSDQALRRAVDFLYRLDEAYGGWWARGDDAWEPWLVNAVYGTSYPTEPVLLPGKNMGWTDWMYGNVGAHARSASP